MRRLTFALMLLSAGGAVLAHPAPAVAADSPAEHIALVDVQRCLMETKEGKRAKKRLEKSFAKGQQKLERKAKAVEKRFADLQAKAPMLSQAELQRRQGELMTLQAELEQLSMELQEDVMRKEAQLTEKIYKKVAAIVEQIALEEGLEVVLVKSEMTVLWATPKLDLTNRVIVRFDKENK
jgi:outer membrane protein